MKEKGLIRTIGTIGVIANRLRNFSEPEFLTVMCMLFEEYEALNEECSKTPAEMAEIVAALVKEANKR